MARINIAKGLIETLLVLVIVSFISPTSANWYGKRGRYSQIFGGLTMTISHLP